MTHGEHTVRDVDQFDDWYRATSTQTCMIGCVPNVMVQSSTTTRLSYEEEDVITVCNFPVSRKLPRMTAASQTRKLYLHSERPYRQLAYRLHSGLSA